MTGFDGNAYRKQVLARLVTDFALADPETGDPFLLFDLDPGSDQAAVVARIGDVVAFWQKERNSVKYKGIAADLVAARPRYEAVLTDPVRRAAAAARVLSARAGVDAERFTALDRLAGQLTDRFGGIPAEKVDQLRVLARRDGTGDAAFAGWLGRHRVLAAAGPHAEPWEPAVRRQIRSQLAELARSSGDPGRFATLWTFLDLSPQSSDAELAARHAELLAANLGARHDTAKTRTGELLADVKTRLLAAGGRDRYAAGLRADAADLIYPDVAEKALVAGEVTAADYEALVQRVIALDWGISNDEARSVVRLAATALGAVLAVAPAVDYLICAHCRAPQAAPPVPDRLAARCRYCSENLYRTCPNCARVVEAAAVTCPECGISFAAYAAEAALPLAAPSGLQVQVTDAGVSLQWQPVSATGTVRYRVVRIAAGRPPATIGTTTATDLEDAGAPGGIELAYQVTAVAGERLSALAMAEPVLVLREVRGLQAEASDDGVRLQWVRVPGGDVMIERSTDGVTLTRRIRPDHADRHLDADVVAGPAYRYRVFVEYRQPGRAPVLTAGRSVRVQVLPRPVAVTDLWARTDPDRTVLHFSTPVDGLVRIYAGPGPLAEPGTELDPQQLARLADRARLVGSARRRVIDPVGSGRIHYTPVTVAGDRAVVGPGLVHLAVGPVTNLAAQDRGGSVLLTFDLPRGATEAMISWRSGQPPSGPDDPAALAAKVTNTKLEIAGGFELPAPDDGRALHVAVYPALRVDGRLTPGPDPATLTVLR